MDLIHELVSFLWFGDLSYLLKSFLYYLNNNINIIAINRNITLKQLFTNLVIISPTIRCGLPIVSYTNYRKDTGCFMYR